MNLSASLIIIFIVIAGPALGGGLIPSLLKYDPSPTSLSSNDSKTLVSSSLDEPANIQTDSANITLEYNAENLIRTKTNGKLTADVTTWGRAESLFFPLHIVKQPTTFALSHAVSNASAFYEDEDTGTELTLKTDSYAWAISHSIGETRIGIAGSQYSSLIPGRSAFPQHVFRIFNGWTPIKFSLEEKDILFQAAQPISNNSEVCITLGKGNNALHTVFGQDGNRISIPAEANTTKYGIDIKRQMNRKLNIGMGYSRSSGSGSNFIYRNESKSGTLLYDPKYHQLSASVNYQKSPTSVWETGYTSSSHGLHLRGLSLKGNDLGIKVEPFADRIDFSADADLLVSYFYLGNHRKVSDKWSLGWRYKYAKIDSELNADYIGRAFFGLINVTGSYNNSLLTTHLHDLELSAKYARNSTSIEIRLEQAIPTSSGSDPDSSDSNPHHPAAPTKNRKSTGGTSLSITSSYAF